MNRKITKKLQLSKVTISNLSSDEKVRIRGGYISFSCPGYGCETLPDPACTDGCPSFVIQYCQETEILDCETEQSYCTCTFINC